MNLYTSDGEKFVNIGMGSIWYCIYSTATLVLPVYVKKEIPQALSFLINGECSFENVKSTKQQMEILQGEFSKLSPNQVVYDLHKPNMAPPWANNIAPTVTSCANLYTTADGEDLFTEVINLLTYAQENQVSVFAG